MKKKKGNAVLDGKLRGFQLARLESQLNSKKGRENNGSTEERTGR